LFVLLFFISLSAVIIKTFAQSGDYILGMQHPQRKLITFYPNLALLRLAINPGLKMVSNESFFPFSSSYTSPFVLEYNKQDFVLAPIADTNK